jgi:hypothetical protein
MQIHSVGIDLGKTNLSSRIQYQYPTFFAATNGRVRDRVLTLIIQYH